MECVGQTSTGFSFLSVTAACPVMQSRCLCHSPHDGPPLSSQGAQLKAAVLQAGVQNGVPTSSVRGFRALDVDSVREYLAEREDLATRLGPRGSESSWQV